MYRKVDDVKYKTEYEFESVTFAIFHCLTTYLRYEKGIAPGVDYLPVVQDVVAACIEYVRCQSNCNKDRVSAAQILNLIKAIYQRLILIGDVQCQNFVVDQLKSLESDILKSEAQHKQLYLNLIRQYQRILPDHYMGLPAFED